jgi:hypothetical protein
MRLRLLALIGSGIAACNGAEPGPPWNADLRSPDLLRPDQAAPGEDTPPVPDGPGLSDAADSHDLPAPPSFSDVPAGHPHHTEITWVAQMSIMEPCQPNLFCPGAQVPRAEMATAVGRMKLGASFTPNPTPHFSDVPTSHPAFKYVQGLADHGSLAGCGGGLFCPDAGATRAAVAILMIKTKFGDSFGYSTMPHFSDVPAGHPAFKFVQKMKDEQIAEGCGGGKYCPDDIIQRQQLAVFLYMAKTL